MRWFDWPKFSVCHLLILVLACWKGRTEKRSRTEIGGIFQNIVPNERGQSIKSNRIFGESGESSRIMSGSGDP